MGSKTLEQRVGSWQEKNPLRAWRTKTGTTIATVASALGKSAVAISSYERGEYRPSQQSLLNMAALKDCLLGEITKEWDQWIKRRPKL